LKRPVWLAKHRAAQEDQVGLAVGHDLLRHIGALDKADSPRRNVRTAAYLCRKRYLVSRVYGQLLGWTQSTARAVDQIDLASGFQHLRELHARPQVPAALYPVRRRDAHEQGQALRPLGTDWRKPHIEVAPFLIVVFEQAYGMRPDGAKVKHYYVRESVGIAVGLLLASLHEAGLATLTHTPSPMGFLREALGRPENERPYVLIPVGYPADGCAVPDLGRKALAEILVRR